MHAVVCKTLRMTVRTVPTAVIEAREARSDRRIPVNMSLPQELVRQLDEVAGPRNRSTFAEEALRRAIRREQLRLSIERTAGSLKAEDYPHWRTSEDVVRWVEEMRAEVTSVESRP